MKKLLLSAGMMLLSLASCSPVVYNFSMDKSAPSESGISMAGKTISVVYAYPVGAKDSSMVAEMAMGLARELDAGYYGGTDGVPVFSRSYDGQEPVKDSMVNMVVETGGDVVFYLYGANTGYYTLSGTQVNMPFAVSLAIYDAMNPSDTVIVEKFSDSYIWTLNTTEASDERIAGEVVKALPYSAFSYGKDMAAKYLPVWVPSSFPIYVYTSDSGWTDAVVMALEEMKWKEALDIWMKKADTGNLQKRASAAYNCALACHMMGQNAMAAKWLEYADSIYSLPYSKALRSELEAQKGK